MIGDDSLAFFTKDKFIALLCTQFLFNFMGLITFQLQNEAARHRKSISFYCIFARVQGRSLPENYCCVNNYQFLDKMSNKFVDGQGETLLNSLNTRLTCKVSR